MTEINTTERHENQQIIVDQNQSLLRIDKFLMERIRNASRSKIQEAIRCGFVRVNGKGIKPNYKVRCGDVIITYMPEPPHNDEVIPEDIPLEIIHEDKDIIVVNKRAGMVVHPAYQNWQGTLVNALAYHFRSLPEMPGNIGRPGLVHRIDKDTSGLLVVAKTENAMEVLAKQFFDHSIDRTYHALVWGEPAENSGTIEVNLGRSLRDRRVTTAFPNGDMGQKAITHFNVLERLYYVTLVECKLETGRTHQIRAHMKYIGHPLFNDSNYGGNNILKGTVFTKYKQFVANCFKTLPRQALHAKTLGFKHPTLQKYVSYDSALPDDFENVLKKWRKYLNYTD